MSSCRQSESILTNAQRYLAAKRYRCTENGPTSYMSIGLRISSKSRPNCITISPLYVQPLRLDGSGCANCRRPLPRIRTISQGEERGNRPVSRLQQRREQSFFNTLRRRSVVHRLQCGSQTRQRNDAELREEATLSHLCFPHVTASTLKVASIQFSVLDVLVMFERANRIIFTFAVSKAGDPQQAPLSPSSNCVRNPPQAPMYGAECSVQMTHCHGFIVAPCPIEKSDRPPFLFNCGEEVHPFSDLHNSRE
jgi:hypothetical protein